MMPPQVRLYTWLDVEDTLLRALEARSGGEQSWFVDATAYWDRLVVRVRPGNESQAERWLRELFDPRTTPPERELEIVLESSDGQERRLPVAIEAAEGPEVRGRATPSFARPSFIRREREPLEPPELPPGSPPIFAMHSFKGGVGRTIHALALARVIAEECGRTLLVDARCQPSTSRLHDCTRRTYQIIACLWSVSPPCGTRFRLEWPCGCYEAALG